jgi:hypothetical protein
MTAGRWGDEGDPNWTSVRWRIKYLTATRYIYERKKGRSVPIQFDRQTQSQPHTAALRWNDVARYYNFYQQPADRLGDLYGQPFVDHNGRWTDRDPSTGPVDGTG